MFIKVFCFIYAAFLMLFTTRTSRYYKLIITNFYSKSAVSTIYMLFGLFCLHKIRGQYHANFWKVKFFMHFLIKMDFIYCNCSGFNIVLTGGHSV